MGALANDFFFPEHLVLCWPQRLHTSAKYLTHPVLFVVQDISYFSLYSLGLISQIHILVGGIQHRTGHFFYNSSKCLKNLSEGLTC